MSKKIIRLIVPFQVLCIDDKNKPETIPNSKWIKEGELYTVVHVSNLKFHDGLAVKLKEKDLSDCVPYTFFDLSRFMILVDEDLGENSEEVSDITIDENDTTPIDDL
jgi:hypothetical protein